MDCYLETGCGKLRGNIREDCKEYLGIRYAKAERFEYAKPVEHWDGTLDATAFGPVCMQYRAFFPHLDVPERLFYYREFREGQEFEYSEDCLNLNIYTPLTPGTYPVIVYIHGGGFNSMANSEGYLDGAGYAKRGVILVTINYRVGVFGYFTHEKIYEKYGRDGNFGLDDQLTALRWVREHIADFGGDPKRITVMGQSAGALSIQYLCLSDKVKKDPPFQRAIMMSGAGAFPKFALPKQYTATREYWKKVIELSGAKDYESFLKADGRTVLAGVEEIKKLRRDSQTVTQPVVDGYLLTDSVDRLIKDPLPADYLIGYTNNDMFTAVLARMAHKYARKNHAYLYYFDVDAPGDDHKQAFHSADLRYVFGTLDKSFRPYGEQDVRISEMMMDYIASFTKTGDPNGEGRPVWERGKGALVISKNGTKMGKPDVWKLIRNTFS